MPQSPLGLGRDEDRRYVASITAIDDKFAELLNEGVDVGMPKGDEVEIGGGSYREFEVASIFQHPDIGASLVNTQIAEKYWAIGGPEGQFGWPISDSAPAAAGRFNRFQFQGSIIVAGEDGVFEVHGLIGEAYFLSGGPDGPLGAPITDESAAGEGRFNAFDEAGSGIWWLSDLGAQVIRDWAAESATAAVTADLMGFSLPDSVLDELQLSDPNRICFPISSFLNDAAAQLFGYLAEEKIRQDYCTQLGCSLATDYFDTRGWPISYFDFLRSHHPALAVTKKFVAGSTRPDIVTDAPPRQEWYEIKPLSLAGVIAGLRKLAAIPVFMSRLGLPYVPGTAYTPTPEIDLGKFTVAGVDIDAFLCVERPRRGLVTYRLGLKGDQITLVQRVRFAAAALAIVLALLIALKGIVALPEGLPEALPRS